MQSFGALTGVEALALAFMPLYKHCDPFLLIGRGISCSWLRPESCQLLVRSLTQSTLAASTGSVHWSKCNLVIVTPVSCPSSECREVHVCPEKRGGSHGEFRPIRTFVAFIYTHVVTSSAVNRQTGWESIHRGDLSDTIAGSIHGNHNLCKYMTFHGEALTRLLDEPSTGSTYRTCRRCNVPSCPTEGSEQACCSRRTV
jgi:hypothetical protein